VTCGSPPPNAKPTKNASAPSSTSCCADKSHPAHDATSKHSPAKPASTAPPSTATAPTPHLRLEFEQRLSALQADSDQRPDPRDAQIDRLKTEIAALKKRLDQANGTIDELTDFRTQALARLAEQHDEITRLHDSAAAASHVRRLPQRAAFTGSRN
jgi:hypothetical protein